MIKLNIRCITQEEMVVTKVSMHNGLVGSPAYVNSEIAICDVDDKSFMLVVGNGNNDDIEYDVRVM